MLGQKVTEEEGDIVASILNVQNIYFEEKYLGLPVPEGRMKDDKFQPTKERLMTKCSDWTEKYSLGAAKEVLIKAVAQAIPTHAMSVFKFSAGLCDELEQIIRDFWWGDGVDKRKVHWMSWEKND
jgi:phosphoribosylaminoimidazole-succinocarboxamide synthase